VTELDQLWQEVHREFAGYARHEFRGAMNGVEVNMEVIRSRMAAGKTDHSQLAPFLEAANGQLQEVQGRAESLHFFMRVQLGQMPEADVALTLKHLATVLVPAAKGEGTTLDVTGYDTSAPTSAPAKAVALALASGLMALIKEGGSGACQLKGGVEPVVRFSHQSATACSLGPGITKAIARDGIRAQESEGVLTLAFPKYQ
jgi:hypothetical protein